MLVFYPTSVGSIKRI